MKGLFTLLVLTLVTVGMLALPTVQAPAEAHVQTGKTSVSKPGKVTGTVYRGSASVKITRDPRAFDRNHIHRRRLISYIEMSNKRNGKWEKPFVMGNSVVSEKWNTRWTSGPQRPNVRCKKGQTTRIRTVGLHQVVHGHTWKLARSSKVYHSGSPRRVDTAKRSKWTRCR